MKRLIAVLSVLSVLGLTTSALAGSADTHQKKDCPCPSSTVDLPGLDGLDLVR